MRRTIAAVTLTGMTMFASAAMAQERAGDAALGAASGAVVLGPVGAVAGAIVGYTAGPSISHAWGVRHPRGAAHRRTQVVTTAPARPRPAVAPALAPVQQSTTSQNSTPPVQTYE